MLTNVKAKIDALSAFWTSCSFGQRIVLVFVSLIFFTPLADIKDPVTGRQVQTVFSKAEKNVHILRREINEERYPGSTIDPVEIICEDSDGACIRRGLSALYMIDKGMHSSIGDDGLFSVYGKCTGRSSVISLASDIDPRRETTDPYIIHSDFKKSDAELKTFVKDLRSHPDFKGKIVINHLGRIIFYVKLETGCDEALASLDMQHNILPGNDYNSGELKAFSFYDLTHVVNQEVMNACIGTLEQCTEALNKNLRIHRKTWVRGRTDITTSTNLLSFTGVPAYVFSVSILVALVLLGLSVMQTSLYISLLFFGIGQVFGLAGLLAVLGVSWMSVTAFTVTALTMVITYAQGGAPRYFNAANRGAKAKDDALISLRILLILSTVAMVTTMYRESLEDVSHEAVFTDGLLAVSVLIFLYFAMEFWMVRICTAAAKIGSSKQWLHEPYAVRYPRMHRWAVKPTQVLMQRYACWKWSPLIAFCLIGLCVSGLVYQSQTIAFDADSDTAEYAESTELGDIIRETKSDMDAMSKVGLKENYLGNSVYEVLFADIDLTNCVDLDRIDVSMQKLENAGFSYEDSPFYNFRNEVYGPGKKFRHPDGVGTYIRSTHKDGSCDSMDIAETWEEIIDEMPHSLVETVFGTVTADLARNEMRDTLMLKNFKHGVSAPGTASKDMRADRDRGNAILKLEFQKDEYPGGQNAFMTGQSVSFPLDTEGDDETPGDALVDILWVALATSLGFIILLRMEFGSHRNGYRVRYSVIFLMFFFVVYAMSSAGYFVVQYADFPYDVAIKLSTSVAVAGSADLYIFPQRQYILLALEDEVLDNSANREKIKSESMLNQMVETVSDTIMNAMMYMMLGIAGRSFAILTVSRLGFVLNASLMTMFGLMWFVIYPLMHLTVRSFVAKVNLR